MSHPEAPALCRWLRWKGYYALEDHSAAEFADHAERNEVPWSCLLTAQSWGPDDELCMPEGCQPGRGCFVVHPRTPR